jgi:hypothetical protein
MSRSNRKNTKKGHDPKRRENLSPKASHQGEDKVDEEVSDIFDQAQDLAYGSSDFVRKLKSYTDRSPKLSGGDLDASWENSDVGEEAVGGENPTPDQSLVDEQGEALGITYNDDEPLHTTDKLEQRDREPWELNPASSTDYSERLDETSSPPNRQITGAKPETDNKKLAQPRTRNKLTRRRVGKAGKRAAIAGKRKKDGATERTETQTKSKTKR